MKMFLIVLTFLFFLNSCCTPKKIYVDRIETVYPDIPKMENPDKINFKNGFNKDSVEDINNSIFKTYEKNSIIYKCMVKEDFYDLISYYIQLIDRYNYYNSWFNRYNKFYNDYYKIKKDNDKDIFK